MGVLRDWICVAHGNVFESSEDSPLCEFGCDTVEKVFLQPASIGSGRTQSIDKTLNSLAKSYKLTDLGPGAMRRRALASEKSQAAYREFCERRFGGLNWGSVPKGGAPAALAQAGAAPSPTAQEIINSIPANIARPTARYRKDPENLSLAQVKVP